MDLPLPPVRRAVRASRGDAADRAADVGRRRDAVPRPPLPARTADRQPAAAARPRPPILIGGMGERKTLRLVAEHADACNLFDIPDGGETIRRKLDVLAGHCERLGRALRRDREDAQHATRARASPPSAFADRCAGLAALGIEHVVLITAGPWTMPISTRSARPRGSSPPPDPSRHRTPTSNLQRAGGNVRARAATRRNLHARTTLDERKVVARGVAQRNRTSVNAWHDRLTRIPLETAGSSTDRPDPTRGNAGARAEARTARAGAHGRPSGTARPCRVRHVRLARGHRGSRAGDVRTHALAGPVNPARPRPRVYASRAVLAAPCGTRTAHRRRAPAEARPRRPRRWSGSARTSAPTLTVVMDARWPMRRCRSCPEALRATIVAVDIVGLSYRGASSSLRAPRAPSSSPSLPGAPAVAAAMEAS